MKASEGIGREPEQLLDREVRQEREESIWSGVSS